MQKCPLEKAKRFGLADPNGSIRQVLVRSYKSERFELINRLIVKEKNRMNWINEDWSTDRQIRTV
jgi:hypothetical protein